MRRQELNHIFSWFLGARSGIIDCPHFRWHFALARLDQRNRIDLFHSGQTENYGTKGKMEQPNSQRWPRAVFAKSFWKTPPRILQKELTSRFPALQSTFSVLSGWMIGICQPTYSIFGRSLVGVTHSI